MPGERHAPTQSPAPHLLWSTPHVAPPAHPHAPPDGLPLGPARRCNRRRQTADLKHIATYYALERRFGIHIAIGGRVRTNGREGTIVDTAGEQLKIQFDGAEMPSTRHFTWDMEYKTATGWTAAKPVPVP
ncbi:hypothetical protein AB0N79_37880 [Streptomyces microflavus]|uniref:hypothetical protein n=1 Tax=Streptomyces microflavus TaxID=1919 RepID=UPI00343262A0